MNYESFYFWLGGFIARKESLNKEEINFIENTMNTVAERQVSFPVAGSMCLSNSQPPYATRRGAIGINDCSEFQKNSNRG